MDNFDHCELLSPGSHCRFQIQWASNSFLGVAWERTGGVLMDIDMECSSVNMGRKKKKKKKKYSILLGRSMACQTLHYSIFLYFYRILLHYYCLFWDLYWISGHFYSICFVSILYSMICIQYIRLFLLYSFRLYCIFSHLHCIFLELYLISGHFYSILLHYYCIFLDLYLISDHFYYI